MIWQPWPWTILTSCIWVHRLVFSCVKCKVQKEFFAQLKLQKKKRNCWKMPCQNLYVTRRNGHTEYSMSGSWQEEIKILAQRVYSFMFDLEKVQRLDINVTSMTAESLCFWLTKFIEEVCKQNGERYLARTLSSVVCGLQRHLETENGSLAISLLSKNEKR